MTEDHDKIEGPSAIPHLHDLGHRALQISPTAFVAQNATVLGDVSIDAESSVWFGTVIRGDLEKVVIGQGTNIQDLSVLHADPGFPCLIGARVTVGHGAVVHGATVDDGALIGIRAVVLNGARIGRNSIVAAGSLVPENFQVPEGVVVMGVPAKVVRRVSEADLSRSQRACLNYIAAAQTARKAIGPSQTSRP